MIVDGRIERRIRAALLLAVLLLLTACAGTAPPPVPSPPLPPEAAAPPPAATPPRPYTVLGQTYQPLAHAEGFRQQGLASWYGRKFHGRRTANGEVYNMYGLSAAHKTLPLGTWVDVRNLENGRRLTVRINDRGPFVRGRIIDLSYGAAKRLGVVGPGTARVELEALGYARGATTAPAAFQPADFYHGNFTFQVGAFRQAANARRLQQRLARRYDHAHIVTHTWEGRPLYRVRVGRFSDLKKARAFEAHLLAAGFQDAFIIAE